MGLRKRRLVVYIREDIYAFLKQQVDKEAIDGLGATLSGFTQKALENFLTRKFGFKFLSSVKNEKV